MARHQEKGVHSVRVLVLGGGNSPEHDVSVRSANAVAEAAKIAGFTVLQADPADGYGVLDNLPKDTIVLPILHGVNCEDGVIQRELEKRNLAFLGSDSYSSKKCFDKWKTRIVFEKAGIVMAEAAEVNSKTYKYHSLSKKPHVLKVVNGGSSIGTLIVRDPARVDDKQVDELFMLQDRAALEELIVGQEITVPVLDKTALNAIEIVPPKDSEFDYENKYNGETKEIVPAKNVPAEIQKKAQSIAEEAHTVMNCRHLSRTDMMVDLKGNLYTLEINTMPGMTDQSLFPKSAKVAGLDMPALVTKFVEMVKRDYKL